MNRCGANLSIRWSCSPLNRFFSHLFFLFLIYFYLYHFLIYFYLFHSLTLTSCLLKNSWACPILSYNISYRRVCLSNHSCFFSLGRNLFLESLSLSFVHDIPASINSVFPYKRYRHKGPFYLCLILLPLSSFFFLLSSSFFLLSPLSSLLSP